jgi:hypothetical protein
MTLLDIGYFSRRESGMLTMYGFENMKKLLNLSVFCYFICKIEAIQVHDLLSKILVELRSLQILKG